MRLTKTFLSLAAAAALLILAAQIPVVGQGLSTAYSVIISGGMRTQPVVLWSTATNAAVVFATEDRNLGNAASTTLRVAPVSAGAIGAAPPTAPTYLGLNASGATGGLLAGAVGCDQQAFLNMTSATTTQIVAGTSGRKIHVCYWLALANGTTTFTWKRGTGSNCGTGTTSISPDWNLAAQVGFSGGMGAFPIFDNQNAGDALCGTNSATVNLQLYIRYAVL